MTATTVMVSSTPSMISSFWFPNLNISAHGLLIIEPPHDKTNKWCAPSKDSDQPGHLRVQQVVKGQCFFMWTVKTDQTGRMTRLTWVLAGSTGYFYILPHKKWWVLCCTLRTIWVSVRPSALHFQTLVSDRFYFAWTLISGRSGLGLQLS